MLLNLEQFNLLLNNTKNKKVPISPIYLISGVETILVENCRDQLMALLTLNDYSEHLRAEFDAEKLQEVVSQRSLFSNKRIIEFKCPQAKIGTKGSQAIISYLDSIKAPSQDVLIFLTPRLEKATQNSAWVKAINTKGIVVTIWPLQDSQLIRYIQDRSTHYQLALTGEAIHFLAHSYEGNITDLDNTLKLLALVFCEESSPLTLEKIKEIVLYSSHFTTFDLIEAALAGDKLKVLKIWNAILADNPFLLIIWALEQMLTKCVSLYFAKQKSFDFENLIQQIQWPKQRSLYRQMIPRLSESGLHKWIQELSCIEKNFKQGEVGIGKQQLLDLLLCVAK